MSNEKFSYVVNNNEGLENIVMFLYFYNDELIDIIYDYDINGKYLSSLFALCGSDYDLLVSSLLVIKDREEITKDIVHKNLEYDNPAEFVFFRYTGEQDIFEMYSLLNYKNFKTNFDKLTKVKKR